MRKSIFMFMVMLMVVAAFAQSRAGQTPLQGVWRVAEVTTTGPNAATNRSPQPGFYIFTGRHYSIVTVNSANPRPDLPQDTNTATAAQLNAVWGPFTGQSGTYEVSGSTVTTRPLAAKNPGVMASGNFATSSFKVEGSTLTLTSTGGQRGPAANPTTTKLTRVE